MRSPVRGTDPAIAALNLAAVARRGAELLLAAHPKVTFTSGRRNVADQARAMAGNIVKNRQWIKETYRTTPQSRQLQRWVDDHPGATTKPMIALGLATLMETWKDVERVNLSRHFAGLAFDVQPVKKDADAIKKTIRGLPGLKRFLEEEGGLVRWHAEFA